MWRFLRATWKLAQFGFMTGTNDARRKKNKSDLCYELVIAMMKNPDFDDITVLRKVKEALDHYPELSTPVLRMLEAHRSTLFNGLMERERSTRP